MAPRARSAARVRDGPSEEVQELKHGRRWWPDLSRAPISAQLRREVRRAVAYQPESNHMAMWQMNFPVELPSGKRNPVCSLGECGDPSCPTYRPKRPEVRRAVEECILEKCKAHFRAGALKTYASIGCGLLGQDWIVLEQLREAGLLPRRAVFVELRTARPVLTCAGGDFPRRLNLRQTGFTGELGSEFAFSALIQFDRPSGPSPIFEFANLGDDAIFAEAVPGPDAMGRLSFGVRVNGQSYSCSVEECWEVSREAHSYLFTISAVGVFSVYRDGELLQRQQLPTPRRCVRRQLLVGDAQTGRPFRGRIQKIKVWDQEVDPMATDAAYSYEVENAHQTVAQWYKNEMDVYSFGSLAAYAAACAEEKVLAADLLLKVDVHEDLDGYDDFVCRALASDGLALTLGGPGRSWRKSGEGWLPVDMKCAILDTAEEKVLAPWAFMGSFPGDQDKAPFVAAHGGLRAECFEGRRVTRQRRPRRYGRGRRREKEKVQSEGRWYGMTDEGLSHAVETLRGLLAPPLAIENLVDEVDLSDLQGGLLAELDDLEDLP